MSSRRTSTARLLCAAAMAAGALGLAGSASAAQRLQTFLITGNGHGFETYDSSSGRTKINAFYESPYRYLRPGANKKSDGIRRRNLVYDFYFGVNSTWLGAAATAADVSYLDDTNIVLSGQVASGTSVQTYYWSPFGFEGNVMIALLNAPSVQRAYALFNFHLGSTSTGGDTFDSNGESLSYLSGPDAIVETGPGGGAMVYMPLTAMVHKACQNVYLNGQSGTDLTDKTDCSGNDVVPGLQGNPAANGNWMGVAIGFVANASDANAFATSFRTWQNSRAPQALLDDAKAEWTAWRKPIPSGVSLSANETHLWRQSETVLRMAQVRVPDAAGRHSFGAILASLPNLTSWADALDWMDWSTAWVRDGTFAIVALAHSGHADEARMGLEFMLNADSVSTQDYFDVDDLVSLYSSVSGYRISVTKYFGNGVEWSDWGAPGNSRDIPEYNVQLDGWGLFLWAAREYVSSTGDTAWMSKASHGSKTVYQNLLEGVAQKLEHCVDSSLNIIIKDASVWEDHNSYRQHFLFTTAAAARGFCDIAILSTLNGDAANGRHFSDLHDKVKATLSSTFKRSNDELASTLELLASGANWEDGSTAEVFNWGLVDPKSSIGTATLQMYENKLKVASGGYKRRTGFTGMYDNNEWILLDFRIADANRRAGNSARADAILSPLILNASLNYNLLPELYNAQSSDGPIGAYTGSRPMVGYGSGAFILSMMTRAGKNEQPVVCYRDQPTADAGVDAGHCPPETDTEFCARLAKSCGSVTANDNCGQSRTVASCGSCTGGHVCGGGSPGTPNVCGTGTCTPETDSEFCLRLGKDCESVSGGDNCGLARTATSCGSCVSPSTCGGGGTANVCGNSTSCDPFFQTCDIDGSIPAAPVDAGSGQPGGECMIGFGPSLCASSGSSAAPIWLGLLVATVGLFFLRRRA